MFRRAPAVGLALLVAGCSGTGEDAQQQRQQFVVRANAICARYARVTEAYEEAVAVGVPDVAVELRKVAVAALDETLALRKLEPPTDVADAFSELLERHVMRDRLLRVYANLAEDDPQILRETRQWSGVERAIIDSAADAGLETCAATSLELTDG